MPAAVPPTVRERLVGVPVPFVERTHPEVIRLAFDVVDRKGLDLALRSHADGRVDPAELAANHGVPADAESSSLLAIVARKPEEP